LINRIIEILEKQSDKRLAFSFLLVALIFRVAYSIFAYYNFPLPERMLYYELAQEIIEQGKVFYDSSNSYYEVVGPFLPWLNALTMSVFGINYLGLYIVTAIASSFITFFTYKTARLFLNKKVSFFIGIWSLFYFFYFYYAPTPGKDILMALFLIILIYLFGKLFINKKFNYKLYLLFVFIFVLSFHHDERFFMFTPLFFVFIIIYETDRFKQFNIKKSFFFGFLVLLMMIPWTIRNYQKHYKILLISTRTQMLTDKLFGYKSDEFKGDYFMEPYGVYYIHDYQIDSVIQGLKKNTDGGHIIIEKQRQYMKEGNLPHLFTPIEKFWVNAKEFIRPIQIEGEYQRTGYYYYEKSFRQNLASFLFYGIMLIFSIPGFFFLYKKDKPYFILFFSIVVYYTLIHTFFVPWTTWRYRLPLDALFIITGWIGITSIFKINQFLKLEG
jgi:hypothetical protein